MKKNHILDRLFRFETLKQFFIDSICKFSFPPIEISTITRLVKPEIPKLQQTESGTSFLWNEWMRSERLAVHSEQFKETRFCPKGKRYRRIC